MSWKYPFTSYHVAVVLAGLDVLSILIAAAALVLLVAILLPAVLSLRRRPSPQIPPESPAPQREADEEAHRAIDRQGTALIERRVDLDARRGSLGSYPDVNDAFTRLEARRKAGEITDEEFEAEKIRLLTDGTP